MNTEMEWIRRGGLVGLGIAALLCAGPTLAQTTASSDAPTFDCSKVAPQQQSLAGATSFVYRKASGRELKLHVFSPGERGEPRPAILIFFGGGWRAGMVGVFAERAKALALAGYVVILPDYRVSCRDHTGPAESLDDGRQAYRWVRAHHAQLGIDLRRIVLSGGSAGGHLALGAAMLSPSAQKPAALVLFNPAVDLSTMPEYIALTRRQALAISPVRWRVKGLPPTIIFHGQDDRTVPIDTARGFCRMASDAGSICQVVAYAGQDHGFFHKKQVDAGLAASPYEDTLARSLTFLDAVGLGADRQSLADVYLLAGQSNMSGRGELADLTAAEREPDPAILLYGNDDKTRPATDPLDSAEGQVDTVSADPTTGVGPGLTFARTLRATEKRRIILVPCAKGGSSMAEWKPTYSRTSLYGSCLTRARQAGGRLAGVLWYQGEADGRTEEAALRWNQDFRALTTRLRLDLAAPRLPVVYVQLADSPGVRDGVTTHPAWASVQAAQAAAQTLNCVAMVSAQGLAKRDDQMHLTTASQRQLGVQLAGQMAALHAKACR